jgi:EpsI family protein
MKEFIANRLNVALSAILLLGIISFYAYPKAEITPQFSPLIGVPVSAGAWQTVQDIPLETDVSELLKADDTLNRLYSTRQGQSAALFVALFKTQRGGVTPHSPKVCLPGSGWTPSASSHIPITLPGRAGTEFINQYIVSKGAEQSLVLYWYQTATRIIANEYTAKVYTVLDGIRYRRSDTSLVRIVVPIANGDVQQAQKTAMNFIENVYPELAPHLPH